MAGGRHFLRTENPTDDNIISNFPQLFKLYVKKNQLLCLRGNCNRGWVFSTPQVHRCSLPPPAPFPGIIDLDFETPIAANPELIEKIKSIIKWIVFCPGQFLVQFWKAIKIGGRRLLITRDQPFGLTTTHEGLCSYRLMSLNYDCYLDGESEEDLGLLGRVFRHGRMESTPNVGYYSCKEQRDHAIGRNIRRSWALPVLESSGRCCVGVLELVNAAEPNYPFTNLIDGICRRVEDVGLRSSETCNHLYYKHKKYEDKAFKDALDEIREVLKVVCRTHYLPLAQTWVLCKLCNPVVDAGGSLNVSGKEHLMSIFDIACCKEKVKFPFADVCTLHSLGKGQGVVGRAFSSHNLVFCKDITRFSITEYPLAPYACKYGLTGCFAISLRSSYTGDNVYVLEFFLPPSNIEGGDTRIAMVPLLATLKQHFQSFKVASGEELGEELSIEVIDFPKDDKLDSNKIRQTARSPNRMENGGEMACLDLSDQMEVDAIDTGNNVVSNTGKNNIVVTSTLQKCVTNSSQRQHRKAGIVQRAAQDQIQESGQLQISYPPHKQDLAIAARTQPHVTTAQNASIATIKAKYGDTYIKFQLPVLSGMFEFQQQVAKRLNLKGETYNVKYQDDDDNWILIACDEDLQKYICNSSLQGRNPVKMSLHPITNCPP